MEAIILVVGIIGIILIIKVWRMSNDIHKIFKGDSLINYYAHLANMENAVGNTEKELECLLKIKYLCSSGKYIDWNMKINYSAIASRIKELQK